MIDLSLFPICKVCGSIAEEIRLMYTRIKADDGGKTPERIIVTGQGFRCMNYHYWTVHVDG